MKSNKKIIDDSTISEEKKEKMSNANNKSTGILGNSTKKTFPSSQRNFKPKTEKDKEFKENTTNEEIQQNNNMSVKIKLFFL